MRAIAIASLLLFSCAGEQPQIGGIPAADLNAQQLLTRAMARYRGAGSYRDSGTIRTKIDEHYFIRTFKTRFRDPSQFELVLLDHGDPRHTVRMENGRYVVITNDGSAHSPDRDAALGGATGVTSGTSVIVPPLLLDGDSALMQLQGARVGGTESIHGERCTRVEGIDDRGNPFVVWIGEESQLIRRVVRDLRQGLPQAIRNQLDYEEVALE